MMRSDMLANDTRVWSSEDFITTPTSPTAELCRLSVAEDVIILDLPILVALIHGSSYRWTCLCS